MPRPPAKRGRVAPQKAGHAQERTKDSGNGAPSVEIHKGEAFASGALNWTDSKQTRDASSSSSLKKATNTTTTSFANSSKRAAKNHETPRTDRASRENNGSSRRRPATASRPGSRGQTLGSAIRRGDASSKMQRMATPGFDSSMLSNFRRRPRQPSILHLMNDDGDDGEDGEAGSSDLDSEAFLGGFDPDDESTPLNFSKRKPLPPVDALPPTPSPRKKPAAAALPPPALPSRPDDSLNKPGGNAASSAEKRKLLAVEIPASSRADAQNNDDDDDGDGAVAADYSSDNDSVPLPELPARKTPPEVLSQTMAPPVSSSVVGSPAKGHPQEKESNQPPVKSKSKSTSNKTGHISTATLREKLLPARRRRRQKRQRPGMDVFDLASDDDDANGAADDDELSRFPTRHKRGPSRKALRSNKTRINKRIDRDAGSQHRAHGTAQGKPNGNEKQPSVVITATNQLSRPAKDHLTYSRRSMQGKENNEIYDAPGSSPSDTDRDAEDTTPTAQRQPYRRVVSAELVEQTKKFAEVDRWTMEFEDVTSEPSSPFG